MKKPLALLFVAALSSATACRDFLDVNTNPNAPPSVASNTYLAPMLHWMVTAPQFDGRFIGRYTQEWTLAVGVTSLSTWDRMGYDAGSDNGAQQWRDVYWTFGQNLIDMMAKAQAEQRWDLLGVGMILKAWGWQTLTDYHGEIIVQQAFDQYRTTFAYDSQAVAYREVRRLLDSAIVLLKRTDGLVDAAYLAKGDKIYNGDRTKWLKFAHGLMAIHLNHYSNKASLYNAAAVIAQVDSSFAGNADDALLTYPNTNNDDRNFWGRTRDNITTYRQTQFIVGLMDGTQFGGVVDPRLTRILSPSPDGQYRGLDVNVVGGGITATSPQFPNNFYGYPATGGAQAPGRYLFDDRAKVPAMTYAQLQFIKAEAALRMGNPALARTAYSAAIAAHIDFVNARNLDAGQTPAQILAAEKAAFLADTNIVPATVTLSHIMSQKAIALFGWGHDELWFDMRRYHYTETDLVSGIKVFRGFTPPAVLFGDNGGKLAQRVRPRYNSEYIWNRPGLLAIGGLDVDYHTKLLWITEP